MQITFYALCLTAIVVMLYALVSLTILRNRVPGGGFRIAWNLLTALIVICMAGYTAIPFFPLIPQSLRELIAGMIFLAGAVFVLVVVNVFHRVLPDPELPKQDL